MTRMPLDPANPFATPSALDLELPDFAATTPATVREALRAGLDEQRAEWDAIAADEEPATVENTLVALERTGQLLSRVLPVAFTLMESIGGEEWDALEAEFMPQLAAHADALHLNARIFRRLESLERARALLALDPETSWLLDEYLRDFRRAGIGLPEDDQERLKDLNQRITAAETGFSQRATKALEEAAQLFTDPEDLAGLDGETLDALAQAARDRGRAGWLVTLLSPTQQPLLTRLEKAATRERLMAASLARGDGHDPDSDTRHLILTLARLRAERARLLGHATHAAAVAEEGTARSADAVAERLAALAPAAARNARSEGERLAGLAEGPFTAADWAYHSERLRRQLFAVDDDVLRPYLELGSVLVKGVFWAAERLYGITFHEREDLAGFAPEVRAWEVRDEDGRTLALFLGDYYARKGKRGGAWMHNLVDQSRLLGRRPVVMNTLNITKPAEGEPTLLTWDEVTTCFHEFGHALHGMFSDVTYPSLSGTDVPRDFVEFPSQVNEMWMANRAVVANFARHHRTGEPLPDELLDRLVAMGSYGQGFATSEYLAAALLDQAWHRLTPEEVPDDAGAVAAFEAAALEAAGLAWELVPPRYRSGYFNHAFGGGYDANYYSYIWAEVLDADTVEWFTGEGAIDGDGGLNRVAGQRFRDEVLSRGNSRDPLESFRAFRGRDADITPLLRRRGLQ
ncbi:MAG: M3 family metallopeptidase [Actinomycetales bacterium]|nr:M3 family metallopeptidase [Actinomycetales bacterium]